MLSISTAILIFLGFSVCTWADTPKEDQAITGYPVTVAQRELSGTINGTEVESGIEILWFQAEDDSPSSLLIQFMGSVPVLPDNILNGRMGFLGGLVNLVFEPGTSVDVSVAETTYWDGEEWQPFVNAELAEEFQVQLATSIGSGVLQSNSPGTFSTLDITSAYARHLASDIFILEPSSDFDGIVSASDTIPADIYWLEPADSSGVPLIDREDPSLSRVYNLRLQVEIPIDEITASGLHFYIGYIEALTLERSARHSTVVENHYNYRVWEGNVELPIERPVEEEPLIEEVTEDTDEDAGLLAEMPGMMQAPDGMAFVPGGAYIIGAADNDSSASMDQKPAHYVNLDGYFMDIYPVTNQQFWAFQSESGYVAEGDWQRYYQPGCENYPVRGVSYNDATAYAWWYGKRLPTEQEWEAAARGAEGYRYPWGNDWVHRYVATVETMPVDQHPENCSVFGIREMIGNVFEWTSSPYLPYMSDPDIETQMLVLRGGAAGYPDQAFSTTVRATCVPEYGFHSFGFRCVMDIEMEIPEDVLAETEPITLVGGSDTFIANPGKDEESGDSAVRDEERDAGVDK